MRFRVEHRWLALAGALAVVAIPVWTRAGPVSAPYVPDRFKSGQPARASDVNEQFAAIAAAVDDNHTRLAAIEGVIAVAGGNVGIGTSSFGDSARSVLALGAGSPPATSPPDSVQLYAYQGAATASWSADLITGNETYLRESEDSPQPAAMAADGDESTWWRSSNPDNQGWTWWGVQFSAPRLAAKYRFKPYTDGGRLNLVKLEGSLDGSNWNTIDTYSAAFTNDVWNERGPQHFTSSQAYPFWRLYLGVSQAGGGYRAAGLYEVELYEHTSDQAELRVRDEAGNVTTLSPHNFSLFSPEPSYEFPWSFYSRNQELGKEVNVDMYGLAKTVEDLSGKKLIHLRDLAGDGPSGPARGQAGTARPPDREAQDTGRSGEPVGLTFPALEAAVRRLEARAAAQEKEIVALRAALAVPAEKVGVSSRED